MQSPREEYQRRIEARRSVLAEQSRLERLAGNARVVLFLGLLVLLILAIGPWGVSFWYLAPAVVLFIVVSEWHRHTTLASHRAGRAVAFYERGLARIEDRWTGTGEGGARYFDEKHPNSQDLDLFGEGSLFQLLNTARTRNGQDVLASWLLGPAGVDEILQRQAAVAELRERLDLREDISLLGASAQSGVDFRALTEWGQAPPVLTALWQRLLAIPLALANVAAIVLYLVHGWPWTVMLPPFVLAGAYALILRPRVRSVLSSVEKRAHDLALLAGVLERVQRETYSSPRLQQLHGELSAGGRTPPQWIGRLVGLIELLNWYDNAFFAPFAAVLLWNTQIAFAIERWRQQAGGAIAAWLHAVGEFEALAALATYAGENPEDPFPEIATTGPCFEGEGLGHPLMPHGRCVRNDLKLNGEVRLLVMSGSNMSGKSTMLRTVGINTVLALAGAPVRATRLRVSPFRVGATLRIQDSLQQGKSRFFAEITRIKELVELCSGPLPVLFLLDELLAGTNSRDRRLGAERILHGFLQRGAIGILTTHDLALTELVEILAPQAANVHFEDVMTNGEVHFDYRMRPGVVEHSNALELMRAVGLEV